MKNKDAKKLASEINALAEYCINHDIKNFALSRIISRNTKILVDAETEINNTVSKELFALEEKIKKDHDAEWKTKIESAAFKALSKQEQRMINQFAFCKALCSKEEQKKHDDLMIPYHELMDEESDIKLYIFEDISKIDQVSLPLPYHNILENFLEQ